MFEEVQLMNFKQGILQIIEPTSAAWRPVAVRQRVRHWLFLADFRSFSRIRAKINENLREKGMIA